MHRPIAEQGQYLRTVVAGHRRYFAGPKGATSVMFRLQVSRLCIAPCAAAVRPST